MITILDIKFDSLEDANNYFRAFYMAEYETLDSKGIDSIMVGFWRAYSNANGVYCNGEVILGL